MILISGFALAALAVYEFSENAGQAAGADIGTAAVVVGEPRAWHYFCSFCYD